MEVTCSLAVTCKMATHMLQALSAPAKEWNRPFAGSLPIFLRSRLGRSVEEGPGCVRLDPHWGQVSGKHCMIFSDDQGVHLLSDLPPPSHHVNAIASGLAMNCMNILHFAHGCRHACFAVTEEWGTSKNSGYNQAVNKLISCCLMLPYSLHMPPRCAGAR